MSKARGCEMDIGALIGEVRKCLPEGWTANESCGLSLMPLKATTPPRVQVMTTRHSLGTGRNKDQEQAMIRDDLRGRGFRILVEGCRLYVEGIEA